MSTEVNCIISLLNYQKSSVYAVDTGSAGW